ncbi:hypothetical protein [Novosphingobium aquae]|uniref:Uncharacterized protein n=1 Tax=Novosphingobium aquae TaxID=3133435 RepID=A0ABU8S853_9SPHN
MNTNSTNAPIAHTTPILAAQDRIKQARVECNRTSPDDDEAERRHRAIMDPAAALICSTEATTTREVEVNLWTALAHSTDHRQDETPTPMTKTLPP